jgi:hypothetical protein
MTCESKFGLTRARADCAVVLCSSVAFEASKTSSEWLVWADGGNSSFMSGGVTSGVRQTTTVRFLTPKISTFVKAVLIWPARLEALEDMLRSVRSLGI